MIIFNCKNHKVNCIKLIQFIFFFIFKIVICIYLNIIIWTKMFISGFNLFDFFNLYFLQFHLILIIISSFKLLLLFTSHIWTNLSFRDWFIINLLMCGIFFNGLFSNFLIFTPLNHIKTAINEILYKCSTIQCSSLWYEVCINHL